MILSGLEYDHALINRILSQEGLMDAIMRESSFTQYIKQQGIEEGKRKSTIEDLLDVLKIRFDLSEAHPLSTRIAAIGRFATPEAVAPCGGPGVQPRGI